MLHRFFVISLLMLTAACNTTTQTTSGEAYLKRHPAINPDKEEVFEDTLRRVASVEPSLTFPARIGLARIDQGRLTNIPQQEAQAWEKVRTNLGSNFGEFIPLSPIVAEMAAQGISTQKDDLRYDVMNKIRLGAARQHLDAVLIYETYSRTDKKSNLLSIADLTIIGGYLLPSKSIEVEAYADAMLIDVMQGYPYGTVDTTLNKEEAVSSRWGWGSDSGEDMAQEMKIKAAIKLSGEVEAMVRKLRAELETKQRKG